MTLAPSFSCVAAKVSAEAKSKNATIIPTQAIHFLLTLLVLSESDVAANPEVDEVELAE